MIGTLLHSLLQRRRASEFLVVITSDHGESLGEHGYYYQHGDLAYQASLRIPLIFRSPGRVPEGRTIDTPVSILDVAPTVLSIAGVEAPADSDLKGLDLSRLWQPDAKRQQPPESRPLIGESGTAAYPANPLRDIGGRRSSGLRFARDIIG